MSPPHEAAIRWLRSVPADQAYISVAVIAEVRMGIANKPVTAAGLDLEAWLVGSLLPFFAGRILPADDQIAHRWGVYAHRLKALSVQDYVMDALLAATAAEHDLVVATRNVKHFAPLDVRTFNPFGD